MGEATTKQKAKAVFVFTLNVAQWIAPCVRAMRAPSLANNALTDDFPGLAIDPARENKKVDATMLNRKAPQRFGSKLGSMQRQRQRRRRTQKQRQRQSDNEN